MGTDDGVDKWWVIAEVEYAYSGGEHEGRYYRLVGTASMVAVLHQFFPSLIDKHRFQGTYTSRDRYKNRTKTMA